jgi:hypothetical protein
MDMTPLGDMKSTDVVHVVFAVCGTEWMLIYGEERLRHIVADDEAQQLLTVQIPIGRPESAQVLEAVFTEYPDLTVGIVQRMAVQVPGMERTMEHDGI